MVLLTTGPAEEKGDLFLMGFISFQGFKLC